VGGVVAVREDDREPRGPLDPLDIASRHRLVEAFLLAGPDGSRPGGEADERPAVPRMPILSLMIRASAPTRIDLAGARSTSGRSASRSTAPP